MLIITTSIFNFCSKIGARGVSHSEDKNNKLYQRNY